MENETNSNPLNPFLIMLCELIFGKQFVAILILVLMEYAHEFYLRFINSFKGLTFVLKMLTAEFNYLLKQLKNMSL